MSEFPLYPRCESPCCSSDARLSGLCEMHYWKREAERLSAEVDALKALTPIIHGDIEIRRFRIAGLPVEYGSDYVFASVDGSSGEWDVGFLTGPHRCEFASVATFENAVKVARAKALIAGVTRQPLSLTRETVLNLTPRAAKPPPTLAPPIDVAVEKKGKR